jgi:hypothetical protein
MEQTELEKDLSERLQCLMIFINNNYMDLTPEVRKTIKSIANGRVKYNTQERKLEMKLNEQQRL